MKDKVRVMGNIGADSTVVIGCPIPVVMEWKSHDRDKKAGEQERKKLPIHRITMYD